MIWTIKVVFCLLLTSLTGSIVFVFWSLLGDCEYSLHINEAGNAVFHYPDPVSCDEFIG